MSKENAYHIRTGNLSDEDKATARILLERRDEILDALAVNGMHEDETYAYAYYVPSDIAFNQGKGKWQLRSMWALVLMARAEGAEAAILDCDRDGDLKLPEFCGGKEGFHRVYVTDPFAALIDAAIERCKEKMPKAG